jgi:hypothetical protein
MRFSLCFAVTGSPIGKYDVILQNANEPNPNGVLVGVITLENMSEYKSEYKRCKSPWLPAA